MPTIFFTLRFEVKIEQAVRRLWDAIAQEDIQVPGLIGHRPHITVTAYDVDNVEPYFPLLDEAVRDIDPFPLALDDLGIFASRRVVFLAPRMTDPLYSLHRKLVDRFSETLHAPLKYEQLSPDNWVPHCTLAADLAPEKLRTVVDVWQRRWNPISGLVEGVGVLVPPEVTDRHDSSLGGH